MNDRPLTPWAEDQVARLNERTRRGMIDDYVIAHARFWSTATADDIQASVVAANALVDFVRNNP